MPAGAVFGWALEGRKGSGSGGSARDGGGEPRERAEGVSPGVRMPHRAVGWGSP